MKSVSISRHKYELARAVLDKPLIKVGRSPDCDIVLRAKGVKSEHFHIKWNGVGAFDPTQDNWSLEDLSAGAPSHTYLLSESENVCDGFIFKKDNSVYKSRPRIGGTLLRELSQRINEETQISKSRDLEIVWMGSRGAVKEVLHLNLKDLAGRLVAPVKLLPNLKVMGIEDANTSKIHLKVFSSSLKEAVAMVNGAEVSFSDVILKDNQTLKLSWGKEMLFLRIVSKVALPKEKTKRAEPLLFLSSILGTLFLSSLILFSGGDKNNVEVAKEEPKLIKIEIPAEEAPPVPVAASEVAEVEKSISLTKPVEVPVAVEAPSARPAKKTAAASGAAPSSGMKGGGRDLNASRVLSLLSKNKLAKGDGIMAKDVLNAEVASQVLASQNENAAVMIKRLPGGIINNKGKGGAPDGTGEDTGLVAAASTSKLNVEPGATSIGKLGTFGNGKGASFAKIGNGNGRGTGAFGDGTGNALFGSREVAVVGGLDRETVRRVIAGQKGKVQVCYDKALVVNPEIGGRIVYKWKIQPTGNVSATAITKSHVASRILEGCVESVIKDMLFPKALNGAVTTVIYPFEFFAKN